MHVGNMLNVWWSSTRHCHSHASGENKVGSQGPKSVNLKLRQALDGHVNSQPGQHLGNYRGASVVCEDNDPWWW